jgi:hypothetical protein
MFGKRHASQLYVLDSETSDHCPDPQQLYGRDGCIFVGALASLDQFCAAKVQLILDGKVDNSQPNLGCVSSRSPTLVHLSANNRLTKYTTLTPPIALSGCRQVTSDPSLGEPSFIGLGTQEYSQYSRYRSLSPPTCSSTHNVDLPTSSVDSHLTLRTTIWTRSAPFELSFYSRRPSTTPFNPSFASRRAQSKAVLQCQATKL